MKRYLLAFIIVFAAVAMLAQRALKTVKWPVFGDRAAISASHEGETRGAARGRPAKKKKSRNDIVMNVVEDPRYLIYVPRSIQPYRKRPLVIAFDPAGNAAGMISFWKPIADRHGLVILASRKFSAGAEPGGVFEELISALPSVTANYPVDRMRVIAAGVAGGGMAAHLIARQYPERLWAVISSCGRIRPECLDPDQINKYPPAKVAVFIASPADDTYPYMQTDQQALKDAGWNTKWIEFPGGRRTAPQSAYEKAIAWLEAQPPLQTRW